MKGSEWFLGDFGGEIGHYFPRDGILFIMFCIVLICEDPFLRDMGLCVEGLFGRWLGEPTSGYVTYHIRRSQAAVLFHAALPICYAWFLDTIQLRQAYLQFAMIPLIIAATVVASYNYGFLFNPVERQLLKMKEPGESVIQLIQLINANMNPGGTFRSFQNRTVTVTRDFIVKQTAYSFFICRQSQATVRLIRGLGDEGESGSYVIEITAQNTTPFRVVIHVDAIDAFKEALATPIEQGDGASALSLADKFIDEAKRLTDRNPRAPPHESDLPGQMCFACDEHPASVRLSSCPCQTMFCVECMVRCFIAKQNIHRRQSWLQGSAPCPHCQKHFNILNVCRLQSS